MILCESVQVLYVVLTMKLENKIINNDPIMMRYHRLNMPIVYLKYHLRLFTILPHLNYVHPPLCFPPLQTYYLFRQKIYRFRIIPLNLQIFLMLFQCNHLTL